ncbi:hypothetical protein [Marinoscillum furvescens]|uniref:hypothetical protein n=1 Tax=Marinoscillum furvescens TaxID=1026 RepID=UPI000E267005|nr:hypothetical protein [Marinoscillum furvescens]
MKKYSLFVLLNIGVLLVGSAQDQHIAAEPTTSQQMILYGMTALGVALILLAFRNKFLKRK